MGVSAALAAIVLLLGLVSPREVPDLLGPRLLDPFALLTVALGCTRESGLLHRLVARTLGAVRTERSLAYAAIASRAPCPPR